MKRILIADDYSTTRKGIKLILMKEFKDFEFGEAVNSIEIFKKLKEKEWNILILDMNMPGRNGLEVLQQLKDEKIEIKTLMFSKHPEEQIAIRALRAGASGYLAKDTADTELVFAIHQLLNGKKYITSAVAEQLAIQLENPGNKAPHELLSDREYQTLLLFAKGKTVSEIAIELSLSIPTISTYRQRLLEKMNLKNNAELALYAINNHLL